ASSDYMSNIFRNQRPVKHQLLRSFPTRRSSDLMLVAVHCSGRPTGTLTLRARDGIVETAHAFEYALPDGARGFITNHPHASLRTPNPSNELALEPSARYLISLRTSGTGAAD